MKRQGANLFVRGIRTWEKDGKAERKLQILNTWGPIVLGPFWWPLPTIFLESVPTYTHVSSTLVRSMSGSDRTTLEKEEQLATLVPASILSDVIELYADVH